MRSPSKPSRRKVPPRFRGRRSLLPSSGGIPVSTLPFQEKKLSSDEDGDGESGGSASDAEDRSASAYQVLLGFFSVDGGELSKVQNYGQNGANDVNGIKTCQKNVDMCDIAMSESKTLNLSHAEHGSGQVLSNGEWSSDEDKPGGIGRIGASEPRDDSEDEVAVLESGDHLNSFKRHLEHCFTEADAASLSKGQTQFRNERIASGIKKAKWLTTESDFPSEERDVLSGIKLRLKKSWLASHNGLFCGGFQSNFQHQFFSFCNSYQDILFNKRPCWYVHGEKQDFEVMDAYLLHVLNHVLKTRDLVTKNNEKNAVASGEEAPRDQGFTRPKVLILLPLRYTALRLVKRLLKLAPASHKGTIEHKARFFDEFGAEHDNADGNPDETSKSKKPADFNALFGGNNDDHFRVGVKFTRKSIKLYSDFYSSDIIVASPLGLITRIGEAEQEKDKDVDFLSSIEILVIDYAHVILMQNWSHVTEIGEQLNQIPAQQHGTDFMRIREQFLNGHGRYFRQTILLSAFADTGINAFFNRSCVNHAGKIKLHSECVGVLSKIILQVRQVFERISCSSLIDVSEARFQLFTTKFFGPLKESLQGGVMIFVSSYFDFVRLRNFLKAENMSFCLVGDYTKQSDISRSRAWFFHGKRRLMLYSERAHFYHRYKIRGIKELVFYSLPENAEFYAEITNMMEGLDNPSSLILFSHFDKLKLERIVGTSRSNRMLKSENKTFMFC